jgi:hypothetical protein
MRREVPEMTASDRALRDKTEDDPIRSRTTPTVMTLLARGLLVVWLASPGEAPALALDPPHRVVLNQLEITLDGQTGAVLRMAHPAGGVILETVPELGGLISVSHSGKALGPGGSKAGIVRSDQGVTISWDALGGDLAGGKIGAEVTMKASADGRSVIMAARVTNRAPGQTTQVLFPDLKGLRPCGDPRAMELRMALGAVNPFAHPVRPEGRSRYYPPFIWQRFPFEPVYQMHALRWMDLGSLAGGLSIFQRKWLEGPTPSLVTRRMEADPNWMELGWQDLTPISPGQTWESGEYWLTPHEGGWAKGIEPYRDYVKQVNPPPRVPGRVREGLGFQTFWINTQSYNYIPTIAADAKAHGIDEICLWNWCIYGSIPVRHNPGLGTVEELIAGIGRARALGVGVAPFFNLKNLDDSLAKRYGVTPGTGSNWSFDGGAPTSRNPLGTPSGQFDIDTRNPAWQKDVIAELRRWADLGITCFAWDVFQDYGSMGLADAVRRVRDHVRTIDPEGSFCVEPYLSSLERISRVGDYTWNWLDYTEAGPYLNAIGYPRLNCNVESDPRVVKMAFADGLYINAMPRRLDASNGSRLIGEEPALSAALKEAGALRRQFLPYFVGGNFLGESVLSRPICDFVRSKKDGEIGGALASPGPFEYPELFVRGRQLGTKLLIIVLNNASATRTVTVPTNLSLWIPPTEMYRVTYYDGRGRKVREQTETVPAGAEWTGKTDTLRPLDMAFFEIEATAAKSVDRETTR